MRSYPSNSPQAVYRLLLLVTLVDGGATRQELETSARVRIFDCGDVEKEILDQVGAELCADLSMNADGRMMIETGTVDQFLDEISERELRLQVWKAMWKIAYVDDKFADAELALLLRTSTAWSIERETRAFVRPDISAS